MRVLLDTTVTPIEKKQGERLATCLHCLSYFAFIRAEAGVTCSNEMEFTVECPVCGEETKAT